MGQYYYPITLQNGEVKYLYSHDYGNGLKLMEHSYIGNGFVNAVYSLIWKNPGVIAWIGDYSHPFSDRHDEPYEQKIPESSFADIYDSIMNDDAKRPAQKIHPDSMKNSINEIDGKYLINHVRRQYIDMGAYTAAQSWPDDYDGEPWCIDPLPLLTACGNGRGGGDYHDCYPDYGKVGIWAFDLLEYSDQLPDGYEKVTFGFTEQKKVEE